MSAAQHIHCFFKGTLNLSEWEWYSTKENYVYGGVAIPELTQKTYQRTIEGKIFSVGVFSYQDTPVYIAWGLKDATHCSFHSPLFPDGRVADTRISCPEVTPVNNTKGEVVGFILDGKEQFGERGSRSMIDFFRNTVSVLKIFWPLIVVFLVAVLWATWQMYYAGIQGMHSWMLDFMGVFFLLIGLLKIFSLQDFSVLYQTYDVVAQRFSLWGWIYPFFELGLGMLFIARMFLLFANLATIVLMLVGAVGIYKKLQANHSGTCACLGGFFSIPLTWVTFWENIFMASMATWMLFYGFQ